MPVRLDLNNPEFQQRWFSLEKQERMAVLESCVKLAAMEWHEIYGHKGLRWEALHSRTAKDGSRLVGDVDFARVQPVAGKITPNPGGVGPMTIAMLMQNTVRAAEMSADRR